MPKMDNDAVKTTMNDPDHDKGAVEQDRPGQPTNTDSLRGQNEHRPTHSTEYGTDFPELGNTPEYSMQKQDDPKKQGDKTLHPDNDPDGNAGAELNDQDPGERQKENQNDKKDDDLAA